MLMASTNRRANAEIFANKAIEFYNKFLEKWPDDASVLNNRALAKDYLGDRAGAITDLKKAKELAEKEATKEAIDLHLGQMEKRS
jgi:tetratricopeptide (TPR) repeat protein